MTWLKYVLYSPIHCPQRVERAGWLGDVQLFFRTGFYNVNSANFIEHFTHNIINAQRATDPSGYGADDPLCEFTNA
jgi:hypothetical protein